MKNNQQEREENMESMVSPSFSSYTSDKLVQIADRVNHDYFQSDNNNNNGFEFAIFQNISDDDDDVYPVFPLFNHHGGELHFPMRNLTIHDENDRPPPSSSSSSSVDELEEIPAGSFCVWTPNSPIRQKKSNSTGSPSAPPSRRWKLLDLLRRSGSDGKESIVMVAPTKRNLKERKEVSAHEVFYVRKKEMSEQNKRKTYLPYRQALIGSF